MRIVWITVLDSCFYGKDGIDWFGFERWGVRFEVIFRIFVFFV